VTWRCVFDQCVPEHCVWIIYPLYFCPLDYTALNDVSRPGAGGRAYFKWSMCRAIGEWSLGFYKKLFWCCDYPPPSCAPGSGHIGQGWFVLGFQNPGDWWPRSRIFRNTALRESSSRHRFQLLHATVWFDTKEIAILTKVQRLRRRLESTEKEPKNHFMTVCFYYVMKVGLGRDIEMWVLLCMWSSRYSFVCVYATANHPQSTYPLKKKYTKTTCPLRLFDYLVWQWGIF
jgi:hypothetical protein